MADTSYETTDVETDAAPSVGVVNLSSLDIGSECTVQTDLEPGSGISAHHEEEEDKTSGGTSTSNGIPAVQVVYGDLHVIDRDLEMIDRDQHVVDRDPEGIDRDQHEVDRYPEGIDRDQHEVDRDHEWIDRDQHVVDRDPEGIDRDQHEVDRDPEGIDRDQHEVDHDHEWIDRDQHVVARDPEGIDRDQHEVDRDPEGIDRDQHEVDHDHEWIDRDQHVVARDPEGIDRDQHEVDRDHEWIDRNQHVVDRDPEGIDHDQQLPDPDFAFGLDSLNLEETDRHEEKLENDESIVNALLDQDSDGDTLLHRAIILDKIVLALNLIELMVEVGLSLDVPNRLQQTALHLAVLLTRGDIVKDLLQAGASIYARDQHLRTPAFIACENNDIPMLIVIMQNVNWDMRDVEATPKLLNLRTHCLDVPNVDGERCLHVAVKLDNVEMARALIENGADPNLPDRRSGRTPLHVAADLGRVEITKLMISFENIDVNQKTYNVESAIDLANMRRRPEVVALLQPLSFPMMKRKIKNK